MTGGGQQEGGECWFEFPFSYRTEPSGHLIMGPVVNTPQGHVSVRTHRLTGDFIVMCSVLKAV